MAKPKKSLSTAEYSEHEENLDGFCISCNDFTRDGNTEADADGYECPECDADTCVGVMIALEMDLLEITE